jgi:hypothetical protein
MLGTYRVMPHSLLHWQASIVALTVFAVGGALCFKTLKRRRQDRQRHMMPGL